MKTAIVYDWIDTMGGAERALVQLNSLFPNADWYSCVYNPKTAKWAKNIPVHTTFIQKFPDFIAHNRAHALPFLPFAFESIDLTEYDLVISVTSAFAKAVITRADTLHICYILTPTRLLWSKYNHSYLSVWNTKIVAPYVDYLKKWDLIASQRPDVYVSISKTVQKRVKDIYHRDSDLVYPPFDTDYWKGIKPVRVDTPSEYFLVVSRLEKYKNVDLVIDVCNKTNRNLVVVGRGSQINQLTRRAGSTVRFFSDISDAQLAYLYQNGQALIMPQEEDFGYTSLEAQYFGLPVISYNKGGASETIIEGKTGLFFTTQSISSLNSILEKYANLSYNLPTRVKRYSHENLKRFDSVIFKEKFRKIVEENTI